MKPVSVSDFFLVVGVRFLGDEMKSGLGNFLFPEKPKVRSIQCVFVWIILIFHISEKSPAGVYSMILKISLKNSYLRWCFFSPLSWSGRSLPTHDVSTRWKRVRNPSSFEPWQGGQAASARVTGVDAGHGFQGYGLRVGKDDCIKNGEMYIFLKPHKFRRIQKSGFEKKNLSQIPVWYDSSLFSLICLPVLMFCFPSGF